MELWWDLCKPAEKWPESYNVLYLIRLCHPIPYLRVLCPGLHNIFYLAHRIYVLIGFFLGGW